MFLYRYNSCLFSFLWYLEVLLTINPCQFPHALFLVCVIYQLHDQGCSWGWEWGAFMVCRHNSFSGCPNRLCISFSCHFPDALTHLAFPSSAISDGYTNSSRQKYVIHLVIACGQECIMYESWIFCERLINRKIRSHHLKQTHVAWIDEKFS